MSAFNNRGVLINELLTARDGLDTARKVYEQLAADAPTVESQMTFRDLATRVEDILSDVNPMLPL